MTKWILAMVAVFSVSSLAATAVEDIDFQKALFGPDKTLHLKKSKGPKWGEKLVDAMLEQWEQDDDWNNLFDDGLNHVAVEDCWPKKSERNGGDVDDANIEEWPELDGEFYSIKRSPSGKSIAYLVAPTATYQVVYTIYNGPDKDDTFIEKSCTVGYGESYIYKNTKDKSVQFLQKVEF